MSCGLSTSSQRQAFPATGNFALTASSDGFINGRIFPLRAAEIVGAFIVMLTNALTPDADALDDVTMETIPIAKFAHL